MDSSKDTASSVTPEAAQQPASPSSQRQPIVPSLHERLHYMDALRAIAMLLGVVLHGLLSYASDIQHAWFWQDPSESYLLELTFRFIHAFRMELFFIIAGFFSCFMALKYGPRAFIKNRIKRIALPFIVFFPLVMIISIGAFLYTLSLIHI